MVDANNVLPTDLTKTTDLSRKIWKFILSVATDNTNCNHVNEAKQLLKEISQNL
jgi:hypothetical protein